MNMTYNGIRPDQLALVENVCTMISIWRSDIIFFWPGLPRFWLELRLSSRVAAGHIIGAVEGEVKVQDGSLVVDLAGSSRS